MNTSNTKGLPKEWQMVTHVFAALGEPARQKIIMLFEPGEELAIKDIAAQFDLGRTTVVHHLTVLRDNGILAARRKGRETLYSVAYDAVLEAIQKMQLFMEENLWAEIGAKARGESAFGGETGASDDALSPDLGLGAGLDYDLELFEETPLLFVSESHDPDKEPKP